MKFLVPVLCLATVSFVHSSVIDKRADCATQMIEVTTDCIVIPTESDYKEICKNYSDKCWKFLDDPFSVLTECKNDASAKAAYSEDQMAAYRYNVISACSTDGDGNECPVTKAYIKLEIEDSIVTDSCASKTCSNALNEFITYGIKVSSSNEVLEKWKTDLNAEDCVKLNKDDVKKSSSSDTSSSTNNDNKNDNKSDDTSDAKLAAKIGGTFLFSLLLSLVFF